MNKSRLILCLLALTCVAATADDVKMNVDWPAFMARQDMVWDRLPKDYYEGPFVGNGLMGAIIFKDTEPDTLRFEISRTDIYDHRQGGNTAHERCRLPIGQALLKTVGKITGAQMRVDLWNAEARGELTTDAGTIKFRCFAPSDEIIVLVELTTTGKEQDCRFTFRPQQGNSPRHTVLPKENYNYKPNPPFQVGKEAGMDVCVQPLLAGGDYATAWKDVRTGPDSRVFYIHVANGIPSGGAAKKAVAAVNHAIARGVADMEKAHRDWWHAFYPASFVSVPDARIESFYWIQWYKLASAMREGRPMVDLFGPWFKLSRWSAYWQNLNTQLALYTVHAGNQLSLGEPMCQWLENSMEDLINNAPPEYRHDSASLGNPTNLRLVASAPGSGNLQFIALPWLVQHHYLQYRHTMDDQRLREKVYPLMRRAFNLYLHYLKLGDDGRYHLPRAFSDEYGHAEDTNMNLALLRWGLQTLIASNDRLKLNDPMLPKWKETLAKLADYPVDEKTGLMIGKDTPFAKPHRHYSHLFAIFPLYVLNVEEHPSQRAMMEQSIRTHVEFQGDDCMYKFTGSSSLSAALGDGDAALRKLQRALTITPKGPTVRENTLYSENGWPTFESPISASRSVLDMLLQSWGGTIRVFPACPSQWQDVAFHDLRAEGAFLVSAVRKAGKTQWVRIKSLAGEPCRVQIDGKVRELKLAKGEEVVFGDDATVITPVPVGSGKINAWGVHAP